MDLVEEMANDVRFLPKARDQLAMAVRTLERRILQMHDQLLKTVNAARCFVVVPT
jgi:hypothetical protein